MSVAVDQDENHRRKPRLLQSQGVLRDPLRLKPENTSLSPVTWPDYRRVAKTLALAFETDPFVNYILNTDAEPGDERARRKKDDLFLALFEFCVYECLSLGGLIIALKDNNVELDLIQHGVKGAELYRVPFLGVACWNRLVLKEEGFVNWRLKPSLAAVHPSLLKFNLFSSLAKCRRRVLKSAFPFLDSVRSTVLERMMTALALHEADSVWYLGDVGVVPLMQGHGFARQLLAHCIKNYMVGHWCYLELLNVLNRGFYRKLGWLLKQTFDVGGVEMDAFVLKAEK